MNDQNLTKWAGGLLAVAISGLVAMLFNFESRISKLEASSTGTEVKSPNSPAKEVKKDYLLLDEFDDNSNMWFLQNSGFHHIQIEGGKLFLECLDNKNDTTYGFTSSYPDFTLDKYHKNYSLNLEVNRVSNNNNDYLGLILSNKEYDSYIQLRITNNMSDCWVVYKSKIVLETASANIGDSENYNIQVKNNGNSFRVMVNNYTIFNNEIKDFIPNIIRPYVGRGTSAEFDNLLVEKLSK